MAGQMKLNFKLFGDFLYMAEGDERWHSLEELPGKGAGKKQMAFLVYLLLNHQRKVTSTELIEHFWGEEGKSPVNSLKNTMHKTRALLRDMFPEGPELLMTQNGGYVWNSEVDIHLDTDAFEQMYRGAKTLPDAERIIQEQEAFSLYRGEIISGVSMDWLDHLNTYYRAAFVDLCRSLALLLQEDERWDELLRICQYAYTLSPEVEEFTTCFMRAMMTTGTPELAIRHYEDYRTMLWREFGLVPSNQVEEVYALAVEFSSQNENGSGELIHQLTQLPEFPKAFQCSLLVFRNLVQLELRNMLRSGHPATIVQINIGRSDPKQLSTDVRRLERTLLYGLRAADPFVRLNQGGFAVLLSGASEENAHKVMERIERNFRTAYPRSKAYLRYHVFPLKTES